MSLITYLKCMKGFPCNTVLTITMLICNILTQATEEFNFLTKVKFWNPIQ